MRPYLDMLDQILTQGVRKPNRTGVDTIALFGHQLRFDLSEGFPLVTTKKIHIKSILYELFWMLNGDSNVAFLQRNGVRIWNEWAKADYRPEMGYAEGELGPVYGKQWREWEGKTTLQQGGRVIGPDDVEIGPGQIALVTHKIDQIEQIMEKLIHKPEDRRNILSSWNVGFLHRMKLPPCHLLAQFDVTKRDGDVLPRLSCHMYIRSWDTFLGGPFNIAQYAFLTHMFAHSTTGTKNPLTVGDLVISSGDTHIYENHVEQVKEQLSREPRTLPRLGIVVRGDAITGAQNVRSRQHGVGHDERNREGAERYYEPFQFDDFVLDGYDPHPHIVGDVAV